MGTRYPGGNIVKYALENQNYFSKIKIFFFLIFLFDFLKIPRATPALQLVCKYVYSRIQFWITVGKDTSGSAFSLRCGWKGKYQSINQTLKHLVIKIVYNLFLEIVWYLVVVLEFYFELFQFLNKISNIFPLFLLNKLGNSFTIILLLTD